jgi:translation initiation factor 1A
MPKNKSKKNSTNNAEIKKRILVFKEDLEEYAQVIKSLGDLRITVVLPNKTEYMAIIPGRFRKRVWIKPGDVVLVSRREFQEGKLDVCYKYNDDEVRKLVEYFEIPSFFLDYNEVREGVNEDEVTFDFKDEDNINIDEI